MDILEIKARIASLLRVPMYNIILQKKEDKGASIELLPNDRYRITYSDESSLIHEFLHACFTPTWLENRSKLTNALEDYRIQALNNFIEPKLEQVIEDSQRKFHDNMKITKGIPEHELAFNALCTTPRMPVEEIPTFNHIDNEPLKNAIKRARESLAECPSLSNLFHHYEELMPFIPQKTEKDGQQQQQTKVSKETLESMKDVAVRHGEQIVNLEDNKGDCTRKMKEDITTIMNDRLKEKFTPVEPALPDNATQVKIANGIRQIMQNKAIGKRQITIKGRLMSKRLGRMPSEFIFSQKTAPSKHIKVYCMVDLSGSMVGERLDATVKFLNTLRKIKEPNIKFAFRGFNALMFKDDEIGFSSEQVKRVNMRASTLRGDAGGMNDDAHFLNEIMKEMEKDTDVDKVLLIMSDGQPAESGMYPEDDLEEIARKLDKSGINYLSIGIQTSSVKNYYNNALEINDIEELGVKLGSELRRLIKL